MNRPRITCSSLQGWTPALLNTPFPQIPRGTARLCLSLQLLSPCAVPAASQASPVLSYSPYPLQASPEARGQRPRSRMQWRLGKPKSKPSVPSGALMCPRLGYTGGISIPCWTSTTSAAAPCREHICSMTETQNNVARKTEILFCLIKLGKPHQNPKSKGMLCSFWQIIIISFIYKNQTAPKPQLHTQKKLLVVSKDYRNELNCLTEQHIVFIPHFAGLGNPCSLTSGWQSEKCSTLFF